MKAIQSFSEITVQKESLVLTFKLLEELSLRLAGSLVRTSRLQKAKVSEVFGRKFATPEVIVLCQLLSISPKSMRSLSWHDRRITWLFTLSDHLTAKRQAKSTKVCCCVAELQSNFSKRKRFKYMFFLKTRKMFYIDVKKITLLRILLLRTFFLLLKQLYFLTISKIKTDFSLNQNVFASVVNS